MKNERKSKIRINAILKLIDKGKIKEVLQFLNENTIDIFFEIGRSCDERGFHEIALIIFNQITKLKPSLIEAWFYKGLALYHIGKYSDAIDCFDKILELNSNHIDAWCLKGICLSFEGQYEIGLDCLEKAIKIAPNDERGWTNKGLILNKFGNNREANKYLNKAISLNPKNYDALNIKGVVLGEAGEYKHALSYFNRALSITSNKGYIWSNKGYALGKLGSHKRAIECFNRALKIKSNLYEAWINKAVALANIEEFDKAIELLNKALEKNPKDLDALINKSNILVLDKNYKEAIDCIDIILGIKHNIDFIWNNKGYALMNLKRYEEAIHCFKTALKINSNYAKAYANKGIAYFNIDKYDDAITAFSKAKDLFRKVGEEELAKIAEEHELYSINTPELLSKLKKVDENFIKCITSRSLKELYENSGDIQSEINEIVEEFKEKILNKEAREFLIAKTIFFTSLSMALQGERVDLKRFFEIKETFKKMNHESFIIAVNSLENFIIKLQKHKNLEEIPKEREEHLLSLLNNSSPLDGILTQEIKGKIEQKSYLPERPQYKYQKEPEIKEIFIDEKQEEWVRFCLAQIDFSLEIQKPPNKFGCFLVEKKEVKLKIFKTLDIAKKFDVNIVIFPELSFSKDWIEEIKTQYKNMIIIGGSFYENSYNICPIIIGGEKFVTTYEKLHPATLESPKPTGRGMNSGHRIYIFQTKFGRFSVLNCIDYEHEIYRVYQFKGDEIDFIINPRYDRNIKRFQPRCNSDCQDYGIAVIQVNKANDSSGEYGKSCIIAKEHKDILNKLRLEEIKPDDDIKYKLCQLEGQMILIADLNINLRGPPINLPIDYSGRIKIKKRFTYENKNWIPFN